MRICIPTEDEAGLEATVCGHFGSAPLFSLLDTETAVVETLDNGNQHHVHGRCAPVEQLTGLGFDAVVVRGMGRNALARLSAAGIDVLITTGTTLREVLEEAKTGRLQRLDPESACHGHGHVHIHGHGQDRERGHAHGHDNAARALTDRQAPAFTFSVTENAGASSCASASSSVTATAPVVAASVCGR